LLDGKLPDAGHAFRLKEPLIKSFDRLRTNGNLLIPFVVSLSNHERNQLCRVGSFAAHALLVTQVADWPYSSFFRRHIRGKLGNDVNPRFE